MKRRFFLQYIAVTGGVVAVPLMTVLMIVNISGKFAASSLEHRLGVAIVLGGLAGAMVAIACSRVSFDHVEVRLVNIATVARISWPLLVGVDSSQGLVLTSETGKSYKSAMFPTTVRGVWINKKLGLLRVIKVADAIVAAKAVAASGPQASTAASSRMPRWTVAIYVLVGIAYGLAVVGVVRGY